MEGKTREPDCPIIPVTLVGVVTNDRLAKKNLSQLMRLWYLSHRRPAKAQASLHIRAVSSEPSLFANLKYGTRQMVLPKKQTSSPTLWLRMRVWRLKLHGKKSTIISWHQAHLLSVWVVRDKNLCIIHPPKSFFDGRFCWLMSFLLFMSMSIHDGVTVWVFRENLSIVHLFKSCSYGRFPWLMSF